MMNILSLHVDYKIIYKVLLLSGKVIRCIESMPLWKPLFCPRYCRVLVLGIVTSLSSVLSRPCPRYCRALVLGIVAPLSSGGQKTGLERSAKNERGTEPAMGPCLCDFQVYLC